MDRGAAWLGDSETSAIVAVAQQRGDPLHLMWFPDAITACAWQRLSTTGEVSDPTPPAHAPVITSVTRPDSSTIEITWTARADLESGIRCFEILRDGVKIAETTPGPGRNAIDQFQPTGFHDTPVASTPAMVFRYATASARQSSYQVVMVNGTGLKSAPSAPFVAPLPPSRDPSP
jgi:hypothetical protein